MKAISNIFLCWRKGKGFRRHIVGVLKRNATEGVRFSYLQKNLSDALKDGFAPYVDFPDINKTYNDGVLEIFGQRLVRAERADIKKYYDFWSLDERFIDDKFYMLAYTQGLLSTDNFEFLADFQPKKDLCFISELCGLTSIKLASNTIQIGDVLTWRVEKNNKYDSNAVQVFKGETLVGYVKRVHNLVFHKIVKGDLKITVRSIDQNGVVNRVFINISF